MKKMLNKKEIKEVLDILEEMFPDAKAELNFTTPYELLVATILSAQCTDVRVNLVTEELFKNYNTPEAMCSIDTSRLEEMIHTCGFYRNKAKNIHAASRILIEEYGSKVPESMEELMELPGVGRKTANVVLANAFGVPGIAVDTHVFRVSNRIGLAHSDNVYDTEMQLRQNIPEEKWSKHHHTLIFLGRRACKARKPSCEACSLNHLCLYYQQTTKKN